MSTERRSWSYETTHDAAAVVSAYADGLGRERPELASAAENFAKLAGLADSPEKALAIVLERAAAHEPPPTLERIARRLGVADPAALAAKAGHAEGGSPVDVARAVVNALREQARERAAADRRQENVRRVCDVLYALPPGVLKGGVDRHAVAERYAHLAELGAANGTAGIAEQVTNFIFGSPELVSPNAPDGWVRMTVDRFRPEAQQPARPAVSPLASFGRL